MRRHDDSDVDDVQGHPSFDPTDWSNANVVEQAMQPRGMPVADSAELARILALPRRPPVEKGTATAEALIEIAQRKYALAPRVDARGNPTCECRKIDKDRQCITRLLWLQAWVLHEISVAGGLIASLPVGSGKGLCNLLAPLALRDCRLALLLLPSTLLDQIITEYKMVSQHYRTPNFVVHLGGSKTWRSEARIAPNGAPEPTLHALAYSRLSSIKSSDWIERLRPDAIIADETDALKSLSSSRCMRILRAFELNESMRFCGWTGSMTSSSVTEFAHLSALALRYRSPMPVLKQDIDEWAQALDAVPNPAPVGALVRLLDARDAESSANPYAEDITRKVRRAFRRRLAETPGFVLVGGRQVIVTSEGVEVQVEVRERPAPPIPPRIDKALELARDNMRPDSLAGNADDWPMFEKLEQATCVRQIASGLFYRWVFPPINGVPQRNETIAEWYAARREYNSELRKKVMRGEPFLDSPKLCEYAARRAWGDLPKHSELPEWKCESWPAWRDIMDKVVPQPEAVRLDSFLVDDAVKWAVENQGIIWYTMVEFAEWARERARELYGVDLPLYGAGSGGSILKEDGSRSCLASIPSHGRGRDRLQYRYSKQLFAQFPSSARLVQQACGRLHRRGQQVDTVETWLYLHTKELEDTFEQTQRCVEFVEDVTDETQKLSEGLKGWK